GPRGDLRARRRVGDRSDAGRRGSSRPGERPARASSPAPAAARRRRLRRNAGGLSCVVAYTWGSTPAERAAAFPCDRHLASADEAFFRAIDVDAPAAVVFRWLCQLRVAPYSYDWVDNFGRQSPRQLTPGLDNLQRGQTVMGGFELVDFERDRHLTAVTRPSVLDGVFGRFGVSYVVEPRGETRAR